MQVETGRAERTRQGVAPIRVMVVDDSAVVRGLVTRMLEESNEIEVVSSVGNGQMAVSALERQPVDVIVLDVEMPVMDGLTAIPKLLAVDKHIQIIMSSTLTLKNADVSLRALQAGAADYIPKPTSTREMTGGQDFKTVLVEKVKALGLRRRGLHLGGRPGAAAAAARAGSVQLTRSAIAAPVSALRQPIAPGQIVLRPQPNDAIDVIAIGSSTGGPQALFTLLAGLKGVTQPILITQHMPATFTTILAEHISRASGIPAVEAKDGQKIEGGHVYVAPGDFHMIVESRGVEKILRLNQNPPENFCRPSVDPMLRSISAVWGRRVLVVILTGMGADGLKGGREVIAAGGSILAQDEATSVVWGMPGAVAMAGICSAVLPLPDMAPHIRKLATKR